MNRYIYTIGLASILILAGACNTADEQPTREKVQLLVSVNNGVQTRIDTESAFIDQDKFAFYFEKERPVADADATYTFYTEKDKKWVADTPLYWDNNAIASRSFCAVSPLPTTENGYKIDTSHGKDTYSVKKNQSLSAPDAYSASDLLIARTITDKRLVEINFQHAFCRMVVNITASTDKTSTDGSFTVDDFKDVKVKLIDLCLKGEIEYPNGSTDFTASSITPTANNKDTISMRELKPAAANSSDKTLVCSYAAIVPDQTVTLDNEKIVKVELADGRKYAFTTQLSSTSTPTDVDFLKQGLETVIHLRLKKTGLELDSSTPGASAGIYLTPWGTHQGGIDDTPVVLPTTK